MVSVIKPLAGTIISPLTNWELTSSNLPSCIYPQPPRGGFDLTLYPEFATNLMVWILILALYHLQLYTSRISSPPWGVWGSVRFGSSPQAICHTCIYPQPPKGGFDLTLHPEFATNLMVWILILALYHLQLYTSRISSPPRGVWGSWGFGGQFVSGAHLKQFAIMYLPPIRGA